MADDGLGYPLPHPPLCRFEFAHVARIKRVLQRTRHWLILSGRGNSIEPLSQYLQTVEVIKNQWLTIDRSRPVTHFNLVVHPVPASEVSSFMLENDYSLKTGRPVVEIFLISESAIFNPIVTPLETAFAPPLQTLEPVLIIAESEQADIVNTE